MPSIFCFRGKQGNFYCAVFKTSARLASSPNKSIRHLYMWARFTNATFSPWSVENRGFCSQPDHNYLGSINKGGNTSLKPSSSWTLGSCLFYSKGKIHINTHEKKVPLYKYAKFSHMGQIPSAVPDRLMVFTDSKAKQCKSIHLQIRARSIWLMKQTQTR